MVVYLFLNPIQARNADRSPNLGLGEHLELFPRGVGNIEVEQDRKEILNETLELGVVILCLAIP